MLTRFSERLVEAEDGVLAAVSRVVEELVADDLLLVDDDLLGPVAEDHVVEPLVGGAGDLGVARGRYRGSRRRCRASASSGNPPGSGGWRSWRSDPILWTWRFPSCRWIRRSVRIRDLRGGLGPSRPARAWRGASRRAEAIPNCQANRKGFEEFEWSEAIGEATAGPVRGARGGGRRAGFLPRGGLPGASSRPRGAGPSPALQPRSFSRVKRSRRRGAAPLPGLDTPPPGYSATTRTSSTTAAVAIAATGNDRSPSSTSPARVSRPMGSVA